MTTDSFMGLLEHVRRQVDARLTSTFEVKLDEVRPLGADVLAMVDAIRDLTMRGGKRFRPALLHAAYMAVDPDADESVSLDAGVALELLQSYLLIHDDWMDQDEMRRGGPAVHTMLSRHHGSRAKGEAAAILAGDYAAALSLDVMAGLSAPAERVLAAMKVFARIEKDVVCGQELDICGRGEDVETMLDLKTGSYTVRGPVLLGAILAGASPEVLARLEKFARPLGVAFQLRDDLLGAFGDPAATGKAAGGDIRAGKTTTLVLEALARVNHAERRIISEAVGNQEVTAETITKVIGIYERSGARAAVEKRLESLVESAILALDGPGLSKAGTGCLVGAASALTRREY